VSAEEHPQTPDEALRALQEGNERHVAGQRELRTYSPLGDRHAEGQQPFAAIIACSDSRVSPTLAFDLDRGNLFVSKVAGNSVEEGTLGSTEYAVEVLGVKLVMVLGHTQCGAVNAAIGVANGTSSFPVAQHGAIGRLVDRIVPAVSSLPPDRRNPDECSIANARLQASVLATLDPIIKPAVEAGRISVVAAVYEIDTRRVRITA
jgi:carbonic anhydrase